MQKHYILSGILLTAMSVRSQPLITVAPGTNLFISPGTTVFVDSLALTPALLPFTLNGNTLSQHSTVTHVSSNPHVQRVYRFSSNTAPFTGSIDFFYKDDELNGLSKPGLILNIHDNNSWGVVPGSLLGALLNQLQTSLILAKPMNELALSSTLQALPLRWRSVGAVRTGRVVLINWSTAEESDLRHFAIERSTDGRNWSLVEDRIPATNTASAHDYRVTDQVYEPARTTYRVRQTSIDGQTSYSATAQVAPVDDSRVRLYPNPVGSVFHLEQLPADLDQLQLYNMQGAMVLSWKQPQGAYSMDQLAPGIYQLRILRTNGTYTAYSIRKR